MAIRQASIVINNDGSACSNYYTVELKLASEPNYTVLANQFESPIVIANMQSGSTYDARITRFCCNGAFAASTFSLNP